MTASKQQVRMSLGMFALVSMSCSLLSFAVGFLNGGSVLSLVKRSEPSVPNGKPLQDKLSTHSWNGYSSKMAPSSDSVANEDDEDMLAQHLMVEISGVDKSRLSSTSAVFDILKSIVDKCELGMTSYSCQESELSGISCVGMLVDGRIHIHSWHTTDEVAVDIFRASADPLQDKVKDIEEVLSASLSAATDKTVWIRKPRGALGQRMERPEMISNAEKSKIRKILVATVKSQFQRIDVVDLVYPPQEYALDMANKVDPEYVSNNPELFQPDRMLYLDGVMQSRRSGNAAYHESLAQPALFAHPNPKRVAVIGGGECATLREMLKHNTVERAVMIEIDQTIMEVSNEHLPDWNDCGDIVGSARRCVDDPRSEVYAEDAFKWFMDRYLKPTDEPPFDVIIMDALDPQNVVEFAGALYGDGNFLQSLYNALSDDGILVSQVGISPKMKDPSEQASISANREMFIDSLVNLGFQSIIDYEEGNCGFESPWSFRVAFKDNSLKANWRANAAQVDYEIQKRSVRTHSGKSPFLYFDGATMQAYHYPPKASEAVFCRNIPTPEGCEYGRHPYPETPNFSPESFEVRKSLAGESAGRGVFALVDIPPQSYIMLKSSVNQVHLAPKSYELANKMNSHNIAKEYHGYELDGYMHGYGCTSADRLGAMEVHVDSDFMTFVNHGCNGTSNVGVYTDFDEFTVDLKLAPDDFRGPEAHKKYVHNPLYERDAAEFVVLTNHKGIQKGQEILDNYLAFLEPYEGWEKDVTQLRSECKGTPGMVERYQQEEWDEL